MQEFKIQEQVWVEYKDSTGKKQLWKSQIIDEETDDGRFGVKYLNTKKWKDQNILKKMIHKQNDVIIIYDKDLLKKTTDKFPENALHLSKLNRKKNFKSSLKKQKKMMQLKQSIQINTKTIHEILVEYLYHESRKKGNNTKKFILQIEKIFNKVLPFKLIVYKQETKQLFEVQEKIKKEKGLTYSKIFGIDHLYRLLSIIEKIIYFDEDAKTEMKMFEKEITNLLNFLEIKKY